VAWQKAQILTKETYAITRQPNVAREFGFVQQLQRAVVSVMSNIAEGFERGGRGEFHQFLSVAKSSCAETRSLLYVALDADYIDQAKFDDLLAKAEEVARIVGGLRAAVERQRNEQHPKRREI
jgi:four helix bundle protein